MAQKDAVFQNGCGGRKRKRKILRPRSSMPFHTNAPTRKPNAFAKTGSGQTSETLLKKKGCVFLYG
jgi:hypothetical protein